MRRNWRPRLPGESLTGLSRKQVRGMTRPQEGPRVVRKHSLISACHFFLYLGRVFLYYFR